MKSINLLGASGSVGSQTVQVCRQQNIKIRSAAVYSNIDTLGRLAEEFDIKRLCVVNETAAARFKEMLFGSGREVLCGEEGLCDIAGDTDADITVNAVVGIAGLRPTVCALEKGMTVALANKETLVAGGEIVMRLARKNSDRLTGKIIPVDSEHSAIFQCLMALRGDIPSQLKGIILTASGGSFFGKKAEELENVTVEQALCHPNWSMGRKITVDSATFMNKGLELIEACRLFDVSADKVEIVVHRQSIVHSAVVLSDNAVIAQMGVPDMRIPIQLALTYPERVRSLSGELSLTDIGCLTFEKPDHDTFLCLKAAVRAAQMGGTAGAVVNGANERAVELFLDGVIGFNDIGRGVNAALNDMTSTDITDLDAVFAADRAAREYIDNFFERRK